MKVLKRFFPFMPAKGEAGKLVGALLFYLLGVNVINVVSASILGFTVILAPLAMVTAPVLGAYGSAGVILAILGVAGVIDFKK